MPGAGVRPAAEACTFPPPDDRRHCGRLAVHQVSVICEPAQSPAYSMAGLFDGAGNEEVHPSRGAAIRNRCPNNRHPQPLRSPAGRGGLQHFRVLDHAGDAALGISACVDDVVPTGACELFPVLRLAQALRSATWWPIYQVPSTLRLASARTSTASNWRRTMIVASSAHI